MSNTQARDHPPAHNAPLHYVAVLLLLLCVTESFSERRVDLLRRAVRSLLFKPELPAVLLENGEGCKVCVCARAQLQLLAASTLCMPDYTTPVSYSHLTLPTNREV